MLASIRVVTVLATVVVLAACTATVPPASASPSERGATADATSPPSDTKTRSLTDAAAIRLALDSQFGFADLFAESSARVDCVIKGGGPPPGISVPGSCATSVVRDGSTATVVVTFTEYWDGRSFHYAGEPGIGELFHTWTLTVDPTGRVTVESDRGNFPPQQVR
ncbi:MAG TPA: hypothetical protein VIN63_06180 [Candidatus Limnocylindria bacterium]